MSTGFRLGKRTFLGIGRVLLILAVVGVVAWSVQRDGSDLEVTVPPPQTTLPGPTDLPTVYPTPDFTLPRSRP